MKAALCDMIHLRPVVAYGREICAWYTMDKGNASVRTVHSRCSFYVCNFEPVMKQPRESDR